MSAAPPFPSHPSMAPIGVAVVEDDVALRLALEQTLSGAADVRLLWAAGSVAQALAALTASGDEPADVLLVDLGLPDGSGLQVIAAARERWPHCAAMVSTIFGDEHNVLSAIEAGAMGYLLKDVAPAQLVDEIRLLHAGGSPINPLVARKLLLSRAGGASDVAAPETALSAREADVLRLVARGHTLDEVAQQLGVSRHTVRTFVRRLYAKLQVRTRAQAVHAGSRQGLLDE